MVKSGKISPDSSIPDLQCKVIFVTFCPGSASRFQIAPVFSPGLTQITPIPVMYEIGKFSGLIPDLWMFATIDRAIHYM
jgi:hypothetical protein